MSVAAWRASGAGTCGDAGAIKGPAEESILAAKHIHLGYQHKDGSQQTVLQDFSLQLRKGEIVALLGASGVGKSTLLRVLSGLQAPNAGQVEAFGQVIKRTHPKMGVVFQSACLLPWRNVFRNVEIGLTFASQPKLSRAERKSRVEAALAEVELVGAEQQLPSALSGGMAQRVAIARCLVRQPSVLFLDEPFSALDAITRATMQQLLLKVVRRHDAAAVLVTHDVDEALRVADRVLLLQGSPASQVGCWQLPHLVSGDVRPVPAVVRDEIMARMADSSATAIAG